MITARTCVDDSCDAIHCPRCGGHKIGWYSEGLCSLCQLAESQALKPMNIQAALEALNRALLDDPVAVNALFKLYVTCNGNLGDHPTVQVRETPAEDCPSGLQVGFLGMLNGVLEPLTGQRICAHYASCDSDETITKFSLYPGTAEALEPHDRFAVLQLHDGSFLTVRREDEARGHTADRIWFFGAWDPQEADVASIRQTLACSRTNEETFVPSITV